MAQTASIIDYPREELDKSIWKTDGEDLQLQPGIKDEIADIVGSFLDDLDLPEEAIIDVFIYGSMLTNQYNSKTDVDARILLDPDVVSEHYPGMTGDELYDLTIDTVHGVLLGDTQHPFNATIVVEGEETELGQSQLGISDRDPVYSMGEEKVIHEGIGYNEEFDPDVEFMEERSDVTEIMTKLDSLVQDAKTNTIDIEMLEEAVGNVANPDSLIEKIEDRLGDLNLTIEKMVNEYNDIKEERSRSYKEGPKDDRHKAPGNIRFKFLEKYRYMDMLKKLKRLFKDGIDPSEVDDIAETLNVKAFPYRQPGPPEKLEAPPTMQTGPPAPTNVDVERIDEGGMWNQVQTQGATCPRCGHANPMTATESDNVTCENCGKKFKAADGFSMSTAPSTAPETTSYPYDSDFPLYGQMLSPQVTEDMVRLLKDVGVSEDALKLFEKKLKGEPLEEEETRPEEPEEAQQPQQPGQLAPITEQPPGLETGVKNVLKPGLEMNRMQAPIAKKAREWEQQEFVDFANLGEEFRRTDADDYAVILEEMSDPEEGPYRVQWYSSKTPIGHTVYPTFEDAAKQIFYELGPDISEANGSMDKFVLSDEWTQALVWLSEVRDENIGGWLEESIDDIKKGHLLFGAIIMDNLINKLDKVKADSTGGTGGPFGGPPGANPGDDPYSSGGGALAEYGKEGEPDEKKKKKKKNEPDDDVIWEVVTVLEGIDILPFLEDESLLEELLAAFPLLGAASTKLDKILGQQEQIHELSKPEQVDYHSLGYDRPEIQQLLAELGLRQWSIGNGTLMLKDPVEAVHFWEAIQQEALPLAAKKALLTEPPEGTGQYRAPTNPDYDTVPKPMRKKRNPEDGSGKGKGRPGGLRRNKKKECPFEEEAEAVGINWFDKYEPYQRRKADDELKELMLEWLEDNPDPSDDDVHALAEEMGMDPDELEEIIYELASDHAEMEDEENKENTDEESNESDELTEEIATLIGEELGIDWEDSPFDAAQFIMGIKVELEHGTRDPETNVTDDDILETAKIAWAHLKEMDDYYYKLKEMEEGAEEKSDEEDSDTDESEESSGGSVGGFNEGSPSGKTAAAYMTLCPNCRTIQKAPMEGEGTICPFCNRGWLESLEEKDPERYEEYRQEQQRDTEKLHEQRQETRGLPRDSARVDKKIARQINKELREAGMDGNGRFETAGSAYADVVAILNAYGLQPISDISHTLGDADILSEEFQNKGTKYVELETPDGEPAENTQLVFQYYQFLETGKYEVLAMLS